MSTHTANDARPENEALAMSPAGLGVLVSLRAENARALHDQLAAAGVAILTAPFGTPFGRTFVFIRVPSAVTG